MKALHFFIFVSAAFCSCLNQKYLVKNQVVFKVEPVGNGKSEIKAYNTGENKIPVNIVEDSLGVLLIQKSDSNSNNFILPTVVVSSFAPSAKYNQLSAKSSFYFPEVLFPLQGDPNSNGLFASPKKLKYEENNLVLQAVTTPLKIRPAITRKRLKDSLPTQALAELNIGAAFGLKRTWYRYKAHAGGDGKNINSVSLSGSGFVSIGGTNVKRITTRYLTPYDKTQPVVSYGATLLFGFNNLNLGISVGTDHLLVSDIAKKWIYDGNLWYGITLAYDIIK